MGRAELQRQISEKRQLMFDEGILSDGFLVLEEMEERRPYFVETIINYYIPSSTDYIQQLGEILRIQPLDMAELECSIQNLKGTSSRQVIVVPTANSRSHVRLLYDIHWPRIGAGKLLISIDELLPLFKSNTTVTYRLGAALSKVISEHTALKVHLIAYMEMLKQMRIKYGDEDRESVGSNNAE